MLDCLAVPQPGDPFIIPKPAESYATLSRKNPPRLRIGWSTKALMKIETEKEVAQAVERTAKTLAQMGHQVSEDSPEFDTSVMRSMNDVGFFGFDFRLERDSKRNARPLG